MIKVTQLDLEELLVLEYDSKEDNRGTSYPENRKQIYIPAGFGHAFLSLEDDTHVVMRIDNYFEPSLSKAITYDDFELNIKFNVSNPILSENDKKAPTLEKCDYNL